MEDRLRILCSGDTELRGRRAEGVACNGKQVQACEAVRRKSPLREPGM